jgi:hypothetical protein
LLRYFEKFGHIELTGEYITEDGYKLGLWTSNQRQRSEALTTDQKQKLSALGFVFENINEFQWKETYKVLKQYSIDHGNCVVPRTLKSKFATVGIWATMQRKLYLNGNLSEEKIALLNSLEGWYWEKLDKWMAQFGIFQEYLRSNSIDSIEPNTVFKKLRLNLFINKQRTFFNQGKFVKEQIDFLNSIDGWVWNKREDDWIFKFQMLKSYMESNQINHILDNLKIDGIAIGSWVYNQRDYYHANNLEQDRIDKLNSIKNWSWLQKYDYEWQANITNLKKCDIEFGIFAIKDIKLQRWATKIRTKYTNKKLSKDREDELNSIKGWTWNPFDDAWFFKFNIYKTTLKTFDANKIPETFSTEGVKPRKWARDQKYYYRDKSLDKNKIDLLEKTKGWEWTI